MFPARIVAGGQTGADRAALDWAIRIGLECGGWCPRGRLAEDGTIPSGYPLQETPSEGYAQRTEWNVRDSDATLIVTLGPELRGGSWLTRDFARKWNRPCLHLSQRKSDTPESELLDFLDQNFIRTLNVAGPRHSTEPGIGAFVIQILNAAYGA